MKNTKIINITLEKDYRIIAISDVHGHGELLRELIEKVNLKEEDYLVIIGDFINKGLDSFDSLTYVKELGKRKNTIVLKGNHEFFVHHHMKDFERFKQLVEIVTRDGYETLVHALSGHNELPIDDKLKSIFDDLIRHHKEEFDYLKHLPIMANIGDFRFVHGGYQEYFNVELNEVDFLKYDNFNDHSKVNDKITVVGHWPICNLRYDKIDNRPYFNDEKNIIFIDGALGVKRSGELNAFIIKSIDGTIAYDYKQVNNFKKAQIVKSHKFINNKKVFVNYPYYDIEVIKVYEEMTLCKHIHSGTEFKVFNSLLKYKGDKPQLVTNFVNNFLNLDLGCEVLVCRVFEDCVLVKYKEEFGWIKPDQIGELEGKKWISKVR